MLTYDELISRSERGVKAALAERDAKQEALMKMRSDIAGGTEVSPEDVTAAIAARDEAADVLAARESELATLRAEQAEDDRIAELREQPSIPTGVERRAYDQVARVGAEQRTYHPGNDPRGSAFLADVLSARVSNDYGAQQRLGRHMDEEIVERGDQLRANTTSANFAGLIVPQYLTDLYAPKAKASRPFADACRQHPLPASGNTVTISRITTSTTTAVRSDETSAVSETNIDNDTALDISVQEIAGAQSLSRKSVSRGTGVDDVVMQDLFSSYATTLDSTLINQGTTGLSAVATAVTFTSGSPTAALLYPKLLQGIGEVEAALLDQDPNATAVVMHSRRWAWVQSQLSSTFPLIAQQSFGLNFSAGGVANDSGYGSGVRGVLPSGAPVIVDNNIATNLGAGTNQDEIYVVSLAECHLWEDPNAPMMIRTDTGPSMKTNAIDIVVYGFVAYTFSRMPHARAVGGTGLVTPTFA